MNSVWEPEGNGLLAYSWCLAPSISLYHSEPSAKRWRFSVQWSPSSYTNHPLLISQEIALQTCLQEFRWRHCLNWCFSFKIILASNIVSNSVSLTAKPARILDHMVVLFLVFEKAHRRCPQWFYQFTLMPKVGKGSSYPTYSPTFAAIYLFLVVCWDIAWRSLYLYISREIRNVSTQDCLSNGKNVK